MDVNEVDYIKIGQRIRAARLKLGWQQAEVAFRAGLTTSHMSHIETGQTKVALPTIVKIANLIKYQSINQEGIIPFEYKLCNLEWT